MNLETITLLFNMQQGIGAALNQEQQMFVSKEYPNVVTFLNSDKGKEAVRAFVDQWQESKKNPA
jgi:hypothetical protein